MYIYIYRERERERCLYLREHNGLSLGPPWTMMGPSLGPPLAMIGPSFGPTWAQAWASHGLKLKKHKQLKQNKTNNAFHTDP